MDRRKRPDTSEQLLNVDMCTERNPDHNELIFHRVFQWNALIYAIILRDKLRKLNGDRCDGILEGVVKSYTDYEQLVTFPTKFCVNHGFNFRDTNQIFYLAYLKANFFKVYFCDQRGPQIPFGFISRHS